MERKEFIYKLVEENKTRHEVHGTLISQGYPTAGYEEEYAQALKDRGIQEPQPKPVSVHFPPASHSAKSHTAHIAVPKIAVLLFFLMLAGGALYGVLYAVKGESPEAQEEIEWGVEEEQAASEEGFNFSDFLLQSKVEATAASANVSGGRMGSYDGACDDITVVAPVECLDTAQTFAVFAPMSTGVYYCVDSTEFSGPVSRPSNALCK
jgi:hypothetical protein